MIVDIATILPGNGSKQAKFRLRYNKNDK